MILPLPLGSSGFPPLSLGPAKKNCHSEPACHQAGGARNRGLISGLPSMAERGKISRACNRVFRRNHGFLHISVYDRGRQGANPVIQFSVPSRLLTLMSQQFHISKVESDGSVRLIEQASSLERATDRVKKLAAFSPGEYL